MIGKFKQFEAGQKSVVYKKVYLQSLLSSAVLTTWLVYSAGLIYSTPLFVFSIGGLRVCTTGYLRLACALPIASSNKSLQAKYALPFA